VASISLPEIREECITRIPDAFIPETCPVLNDSYVNPGFIIGRASDYLLRGEVYFPPRTTQSKCKGTVKDSGEMEYNWRRFGGKESKSSFMETGRVQT